jgi:tetratricopeptide (TPR) repeat protein
MKILLLTLMLFQSIEDTYKAAIADMDANRWTEASAKFEEVLKDDPTHIPSQFNLAISYSNSDKREQAVALYRTILEEDSNLYEAHINLALLLEGAAAAEEFERAIAIKPEESRTRLAAGLFYMRENQADAAYTHLKKAEDLGLVNPELLIALSEAEHLRKDEGQSLAYLERASALDPANKSVRRQLGIIYREAGEFGKAIDTLKPLLPDAKLELGLSYFDSKKFAEAAVLFEELLQTDPNNVDLLYVLGKSYMEQKQYPKAQLMLARVLQLKPDDVDSYSTMGSIFYFQEDWPHAIQYLLKFIELRPGSAVAHFAVATCFDRLGDAKNAVLHYNRFLELDDKSNDAQSFQDRERARTLERRR